MEKYFLLFAFILFVTVITFFNLWQTYFQQDEWYLFGKIIYAERVGIWPLVRTIGFHFTPLSMFTVGVLYELFHIQFLYYVVFSLLVHSINALLVFFVCKKITKNPITAILASVLFIVANSSQQAVSWVAASFSTPAVTFGLLSLLCFFEYEKNPKKRRLLILSILSLLVGLMWKEDIVFLFLFYPLYFFYNQKKYFLHILFLMSSVGAFYIGGRYVMQISSPQAMGLGQGMSLFGVVSVIVRTIVLPFQAFSKLFITPDITLAIAHGLLDRYRSTLEVMVNMKTYGNNFGLFVENVGVAAVSTSFTLIILAVGWITTTMSRGGKIKAIKQLQSVFLLVVFSVLPYALLPKPLGMESRHYYFPMVGASLLGAMYISYIFSVLKNVRLKSALVLLVIGYVGVNIYLNHQSINRMIGVSRLRRSFVSQAESLYKMLPAKTIMISSGDQLNVQSGVGEMLLVIFRDRYPSSKFLEGYYLWDIGSQGYQQFGDYGFGYFSDYQEMKISYDLFRLKPENIYSFVWDSKNEKLIDSTQTIRQDLIDL